MWKVTGNWSLIKGLRPTACLPSQPRPPPRRILRASDLDTTSPTGMAAAGAGRRRYRPLVETGAEAAAAAVTLISRRCRTLLPVMAHGSDAGDRALALPARGMDFTRGRASPTAVTPQQQPNHQSPENMARPGRLRQRAARPRLSSPCRKARGCLFTAAAGPGNLNGRHATASAHQYAGPPRRPGELGPLRAHPGHGVFRERPMVYQREGTSRH